MSTALVTRPASTAPASEKPPTRLEVLRTLLESITDSPHESQQGVLEAVAELVLDAILGSQGEVLEAAIAQLRTTEAELRRQDSLRGASQNTLGALSVLLTLVAGARDRTLSKEDRSAIPPGGRAHQVLRVIGQRESAAGKEIRKRLEMDKSQLTRIAKPLSERRLIVPIKAGREVIYDITPLGEDLLRELEARQYRPRLRRGRASQPGKGARVLYGNTSQSFQLQPDLLREAVHQAGDPAGRSRALCAALAAGRPDVITDQLLLWPKFYRAAQPLKYEIRLPATDRPEETNARLTWDILNSRIFGRRPTAGDKWPVSPPPWDGWIVVHGGNKKRSIVLIEAKSQPQELLSRPVAAGSRYDEEAWTEVLGGTSTFLKAGHRWRPWPEYADPAGRLAFMLHLQRMKVPVWWLNLYFIDPKGLMDRVPSTPDVWHDRIKLGRKDLALTEKHPLAGRIKHEIVPIPEEGLFLTPHSGESGR